MSQQQDPAYPIAMGCVAAAIPVVILTAAVLSASFVEAALEKPAATVAAPVITIIGIIVFGWLVMPKLSKSSQPK